MRLPTLDDWLHLDPAIAVTVRLDDEGRPHSATAADWFAPILDHKLSDNVPEDVRELFDTAKGAMLYGLLFYPLFALATEELFRVCEAAAFHRATQAGATNPRPRFRANLSFLAKRGILTNDHRAAWDSFCEARDFGSHLRRQMAINPASSILILRRVTDSINRLYDGA